MAKYKTVKYKSKVIAQWYTKQFYVGSRDLYAFKDFGISASVRTEEKENGKKNYNKIMLNILKEI